MRTDRTLPQWGSDREHPSVCVATSGERFGQLEVVSALARGGTSGVYLALDHETGDRVALKVLDPQLAVYADVVERFYAEHAVASRVRHPGVVDIRASRRTIDGIPFLVMEYLAGETLGARARRERLSLVEVLTIGAEIADAAAALHDAGLIHCDLKNDNVILVPDASGRLHAKLIDFGVARATAAGPVPGAAIAGTPWCMAPEQWRGEPAPASDVYALGCLLYQLVTDTPPFCGSLPELMTAHLEQVPPAVVARDELACLAMTGLIERCLEKQPAARPTMREISRVLRSVATSGGDPIAMCA